MSDLAQEIIREQQRLAGERGTWETHCQQIAERCQPRLASFTTTVTPGSRRTDKMFDSTAALASENFAAAMAGMTAPRNSRWHGLQCGIPELDRLPRVKLWFEAATDALFRARYQPRANFTNQYSEIQMNMGLFGLGPLFVDEVLGDGVNVYKSVHPAQIYVEEDMHGRATTVYRRWRMPAAHAAARWGQDRLPQKMREAIAQGKGWQPFELVQVWRPRRRRDPERRDFRGMPIETAVTTAFEPHLIFEGGYRTHPMPVPRYTASSDEPYGRSPAMQALPDIKMVNEMTRTLIRATHKAVDPPMAAFDDGALSRLNMQPGKINIGGVSPDGRKTIVPLYDGGSIPIGREALMDARDMINKAFLVPLFSILTDTPDRMTATEVLERAKEKGVLLSPAAGRIEGECLGPVIERELDLAMQRRHIPPMPPELLEAEGEYRITYDNPLTRAARSERSIGFLRTVEAVATIAAQKPEVWDEFDVPAAVRGLAEDNAVPQSWMKDMKRRAAEKDAEAEQVEAATLLQGAEVAGKAALSFAKAQDIAGAGGLV